MARGDVKTVVELGRLAGCSGATVSRALNNSGAVSAKTREAIMKALRESPYLNKRRARKPRAAEAKNLVEVILHRHSPSENLAVEADGVHLGPLSQRPVLSRPGQLSGAFQRQIVDGVLAELDRCGYRAVVRPNNDLLDPALPGEINAADRAGVLLLGEYSPDLSKFVEMCARPLVLVDLIHDGWADAVTTDNMAGIGQAFDYLHSLGHRKVGFVGRRDAVVAFAERYRAYCWKMAEAGLDVEPQWIYEGPDHIEMTAAGVKPMLAAADRPTAVLCANDCYALGVMRAASGMGIGVPGQLSVVGFDDEEVAALLTPALTTVHVPMAEIGRHAVRQLLIQVQLGTSGRSRGARVRLLPELVVRQSAGPAPERNDN